MEIYSALLDHFGPQNWWPGDSPFEVTVGAILTQQTKWNNVEKAIQNLKANDMLDPIKIANENPRKIEELIRPTGFFRQKTGYLRNFCRYLVQEYDADLSKLFAKDLVELRRELLDLQGIGPETADSILLYAGGKLTFVVDTYTIRAGRRIGFFKIDNYDSVKDFFEDDLEPDVTVYNEFHALFVIPGKNKLYGKVPRLPALSLETNL